MRRRRPVICRLLARYEQAIQTAFREVSDALIGYRKTREQRVQQDLLVEALRQRGLANMRFFEGIDSYLQVLDAERELFDAELDLARIQRDERLNIVELYRALGGGWESVERLAYHAPGVPRCETRGGPVIAWSPPRGTLRLLHPGDAGALQDTRARQKERQGVEEDGG